MFQNFPPTNHLTILLTNSFLSNEDTLMIKTLKIGILSRIFSIHRVSNIIFYKETHNPKNDQLIEDILNFILTPPYHRKYLKKNENLKFVGILPPLQSPNHLGVCENGQIYKEGRIIKKNSLSNNVNELVVNLGEKKEINLSITNEEIRKFKENDQILVKISSNQENSIHLNLNNDKFWKFNFRFIEDNLYNFLDKEKNPNKIYICASKSGNYVDIKELSNIFKINFNKEIFLIFGPIKGSLKELFLKNSVNPSIVNYWVNFVPNQGTKTIKLEEIINSSLSIINILK